MFKSKVKDGETKEKKKIKLSLPFFSKKNGLSIGERAVKGDMVSVIDVGSSSLKVVTGRVKDKEIIIENYENYEIPSNIIRNGRIIEKNEFENVLKSILSSSKQIKKDIVITTESTEVIKREVEVPKASKDDIDGLIRFEMKQYLPMDIFSFAIQYRFIEETVDSEGNWRYKFSVAAVPKDMVSDYSKIINKLRYKANSMDLNFNSVKKLIELESKINADLVQNNIMLIDMGHSQFNIQFFVKGKSVYNRIAEVGGVTLTEKIVQTMNIEPQNANYKKKELLQNISIYDLYQEYSLDLRRRSENFEEIFYREAIKTIDDWVRALDSIVKFYNTQSFGRNNAIDQIYLYGGNSYINEIDRLIQSRIGIDTKKLEYLCVLGDEMLTGSKDFRLFINAMGALVRY